MENMEWYMNLTLAKLIMSRDLSTVVQTPLEDILRRGYVKVRN